MRSLFISVPRRFQRRDSILSQKRRNDKELKRDQDDLWTLWCKGCMSKMSRLNLEYDRADKADTRYENCLHD